MQIKILPLLNPIEDAVFELLDFGTQYDFLEDHSNKIFIDFSNREICDAFKYFFYRNLVKDCKRYSTNKVLLIDSCNPLENWRFENDKELSSTQTYDSKNVSFDHETLKQKIQTVINDFSKINKRVYYIRHDKIDYFDIMNILKVMLRGYLINIIPLKLNLMEDVNLENFSHSFQQIPYEFVSDIEFKLIEKGIIV